MEKKQIMFFTLLLLNLVKHSVSEVIIEQGTLVGKESEDGTFTMFLGIPYATTSAENRFQAPLPPPHWEGIFEATEPASPCVQIYSPLLLDTNGTEQVEGVEDCLKINVYVPSMAKKPLPVMVFIHGGDFIRGSGGTYLYAPEFLIRHDTILITFNYRLGALGFLCLGIKEAPGNAGLKDQVAALRWVKKNIAEFGGDPDNITIFGESAGATSISLMLVSNMTEGLFQKAIMQSGSSIAHWAVIRSPVLAASLLAAEFGHNTSDPHEIYSILTEIPAKDLILKSPIPPSNFIDSDMATSPCVEKLIPGVEPFLTDLPFNVIEKNPRNIPLIIGSNSKDGLMYIYGVTDESLKKMNDKYLFATDLEFESEEIGKNVSTEIGRFYFGNESVGRRKLQDVLNLYTHLYFEMPSQIEAKTVSKSIDSPVFSYYFNYSGGRNFVKTFLGFANETGACHADDLQYLFNGTIWPYSIQEKDQKVIDWMTKLWTNFAKFGDPSPDFAEDYPVKWKPNDRKGNLEFLYIGDELKMVPIPNPEAFTLWDDIYNKYRNRQAPKYE